MSQSNTVAQLIPPLNLDDIADLFKRHCVMTPEESDAITLWIVASYNIDSFRIFPKLTLISPEKRCGKTTTLEIIHSVVSDGLMASNISKAVLFRLAEVNQYTLLIDEADTTIKQGDPELIGLINSSHTRSGAKVLRCAGDDFRPKSFSTWMPMVLASIGALSETIMDRSIVINLRRKLPHEQVVDLPGDLFDQQEPMRKQLADWWLQNQATLDSLTLPASATPSINNDRAKDNWLPLFKVAEVMGGSWPARCRSAYVNLTLESEAEASTLLLQDIKARFQALGCDRIKTAEMVQGLCTDESAPWATFSNGRAITAHQLANMLRPYGIKPGVIRFEGGTLRGYSRQDFQDAFARYIP